MFRLIILGLCLTLAPGTASAEDIGGTVRETHGSKASIVIPFELLPNAGDKVSFFSVDPATKAEVQVGTGSVGVVSPDAVVEVTIENATGEITKDHTVRIHSPAPVKSAAPVKQASPAVATPPLAAGEGAATLAADALRSFARALSGTSTSRPMEPFLLQAFTMGESASGMLRPESLSPNSKPMRALFFRSLFLQMGP